MSKGKVNIAKKAYSNLPCDYEITMDKNTDVEEVKLSLYQSFNVTDDCPVHGYERYSDCPIQLCFPFRPSST